LSFKVDGWIRRLVCVGASLAIALSACTRLPRDGEPKLLPMGHTSPAAEVKAEQDLAAATRLPPPPLRPVPPEVVTHGPRNEKRIALTFDACSTRDVSQYDEKVTQVLIATHTPATIFLGGRWAVEEAAHVKELAANPLFELGNHSYTHPHMSALVDEVRIRRELQRTQAEIHRLTGKAPKFFRPPYGEYNDRLVRIAAELGLTTVEYDLASGDPDTHATKERLVHWVLQKAQPGSIVVMHINHRRFHTAEALPSIISGLRARGFELVTVGELIRGQRGDPVEQISQVEGR
jgi:peptidoglycan/xylan/chitin deacetylase (PgdA/CDA1 family)